MGKLAEKVSFYAEFSEKDVLKRIVGCVRM